MGDMTFMLVTCLRTPSEILFEDLPEIVFTACFIDVLRCSECRTWKKLLFVTSPNTLRSFPYL